jgi:hypothetical protein
VNQLILYKKPNLVVAGGQESMSQAVHFAQLRNGIKLGDASLKGRIISEENFQVGPILKKPNQVSVPKLFTLGSK